MKLTNLPCSSIQPRLVTDKPLPKLPRGWSRLRHESGVILRTLGLGIIISTYHGLFSKDFHEPRKIVIRKSRTTSLMRMSIHLIPMSVALLEIILNIRGCYLGSDFDRQSYLQFAAKAHELTVQASLGAMVFSFVRHQVSLGKGMPFGAFLSSLQFSQISYLWSTEFWSSLLAKNYRLAEKLLLFIIVVPCAIIAAVAGPSSATLLIPREGIWPANPSSHFSVNATFLDIWPDRLNGSEVPDSCSMLQASSSDTICPFSDWKSILQLLQTYAPYPASGWESSDHSSELYFSLTTEQTGFSKITQALLCTSSTADQFCASSLQEAILYGLDDAFNTWFESVSNTTSFADLYTSLLSNYYEPYGIISCVADYIDDSNRKDPVTFARISETNDELAKPRVLQSLPSLTKDQALNVSRNVSEYHLSWLELPQPMFNGNAFGAIILSPQDHQTDSSGLFQNITACTLKAGWGTSAVRTDASEASEYYSTITGVPSFWPTYTFNHQGAAEDESDPNFANFSGYQYPQRLINISPDWAAFLNPLMANGNGTNTTLINTYLMATITPASETDIAKLLGIMLTSGLGRNGVGAAWQGRLKASLDAVSHLNPNTFQLSTLPPQYAKTASNSKPSTP